MLVISTCRLWNASVVPYDSVQVAELKVTVVFLAPQIEKDECLQGLVSPVDFSQLPLPYASPSHRTF